MSDTSSGPVAGEIGPLIGAGDVRVSVHPRGTVAEDRAVLVAQVAIVLGCDPRAVVVTRRCGHCGGTDHGQPFVAAPAPTFASLSRAGSLLAIAVSRSARVGVDIEALGAVASAGFDDVALTEAERRRVAASDAPALLRARLWTSKEALLKATGDGLRVEPARVGFGADGGLERWPAPGAWPDVTLHRFDPGSGYVGTVALLQARHGDGVDPAVDDVGDRSAGGVLGEEVDELR